MDGAASDASWRAATAHVRPGDILLLNKSDLPPGTDAQEARAFAEQTGATVLRTSTAAGGFRSSPLGNTKGEGDPEGVEGAAGTESRKFRAGILNRQNVRARGRPLHRFAVPLPRLFGQGRSDHRPHSVRLVEALESRIASDLTGTDFPAATRQRHAELLGEALGRVRQALEALGDPDLAVEDLRLAARALERVTGRIGAEDVLDRVFASFCIGK